MRPVCSWLRCTERSRLTFRRPVSAQPEQAGVGIIFKPSFNNESFMALIVHDLVKGSSADRLGGIHRGDMLQSIDGIDVFKRPAQEVSGLQNGGSPSWLDLLELISGPFRKSDSDTLMSSCSALLLGLPGTIVHLGVFRELVKQKYTFLVPY